MMDLDQIQFCSSMMQQIQSTCLQYDHSYTPMMWLCVHKNNLHIDAKNEWKHVAFHSPPSHYLLLKKPKKQSYVYFTINFVHEWA